MESLHLLSHCGSCRLALVLLLILPFLVVTASSPAQKVEHPSKPRKLIAHVQPEYPPDLKRAAIGGVVRLDIVVTPRGAVDFVQVAGGNPVLAEAACRAVKQWKYAPSSSSTNIRVNLRFDPA